MKFKFDLKNKFDLTITITEIILLLNGASLRFFKYVLPPNMTEQLSYLLEIEFIIFLILLAIKIQRI